MVKQVGWHIRCDGVKQEGQQRGGGSSRAAKLSVSALCCCWSLSRWRKCSFHTAVIRVHGISTICASRPHQQSLLSVYRILYQCSTIFFFFLCFLLAVMKCWNLGGNMHRFLEGMSFILNRLIIQCPLYLVSSVSVDWTASNLSQWCSHTQWHRLTRITCVAQLYFTVAVCPAVLRCNVKHDVLSIIYAHV